MIDIASLITLCQTALSLGSKFIEVQRRKKLSDAERELLLLAAAQQGTFHILSVAEIPGTWVRVGGKDFLEASDPAFAARYLEGFRNLCERGYIVHESGVLFMLNDTGFKKARGLAA